MFIDDYRKGFRIQNSPPYTPQLNGVTERYNQTVMDRARCLLDEARILKRYWPEVVKTAASKYGGA